MSTTTLALLLGVALLVIALAYFALAQAGWVPGAGGGGSVVVDTSGTGGQGTGAGDQRRGVNDQVGGTTGSVGGTGGPATGQTGPGGMSGGGTGAGTGTGR